MNIATSNISRLEFVVTYDCTGNCRHCSEAEHKSSGTFISPEAAARAVTELAGCRELRSVMTFGGEPLLFPETVCAVHRAAAQAGIKKRQLITNGFFSRNIDRIAAVVSSLADSGVNDILLSVDAFHQETIPLGPVRQFALQVLHRGIPLRFHPAWLVSREDNNPYNERTRQILSQFEPLGAPMSEGNIIFPQGNALRYLADYFDKEKRYFNPYAENPGDLHSVSVEPDGSVLGGNINEISIAEIVEGYIPVE